MVEPLHHDDGTGLGPGGDPVGLEPGEPIGMGGTLGRGEPSGEKIWSDRGYMPHVNSPVLVQHVSYHLADSLPKEAVVAMDEQMKSLPPKLRDKEMEQRIAAYLDAGKGSCILRVTELADMVQETLKHFAGTRYELHAWCVMPNHVHVLFQPTNGWTMSKIVASWKSYTGRRISEYAKANGLPAGFSATLGRGVPSGPPTRVWHREFWDRYIRDDAHYRTVVNYIHMNPVKAGLCASPEDWRWSSAYGGAQERGGSERLAGQELGGPESAGRESVGPA